MHHPGDQPRVRLPLPAIRGLQRWQMAPDAEARTQLEQWLRTVLLFNSPISFYRQKTLGHHKTDMTTITVNS